MSANSQPQSFSTIFGASVAIILLLLYAITIFFLEYIVICIGTGCAAASNLEATEGMIFVLTTVSGLVSAFVISQLAITKPGENPTSQLVPAKATKRFHRGASLVGGFYLFVWMIAGLSALVVGVMLWPDINTTLSDLGTTWLGLSVAAGYSYFGIRPKE